ncbi:hypothetical protein HO133_004848 [Letharia lupina]|uniref:Uncharacterized protein n=1 Tax=Letharia lupina TaxID=560253 RepID=A0A8H6L013_9LECA|nr:uncharacterized protein HO133_004848 [Letharia lupina]KAF6230504.1 hypothetical protein HO133_004848 [Letharia lupina]
MAVGSSYGDQLRAKKRVILLLSDAIDRQEAIERQRAIERRRNPQKAWQTSPVNILNMPNPSATPSRPPPDPLTHPGPALSMVELTKLFRRAAARYQRGLPPSPETTEEFPYPGAKAHGEAERLGLENAPSRRRGGKDGWIVWTGCAAASFRRSLAIGRKLGCWKERRRKRHTSKVAPRALVADADARTQKRYGERARNRALARDLERLIEGCETLLQQQRRRQKGEGFPAIDWRPFTSWKRWRDGGRGWTGLTEDEVRSTEVVGVGGGDVCSEKKKKVPTEIAKAVLRARFATCFPRAADKRACTGDGDGGT